MKHFRTSEKGVILSIILFGAVVSVFMNETFNLIWFKCMILTTACMIFVILTYIFDEIVYAFNKRRWF